MKTEFETNKKKTISSIIWRGSTLLYLTVTILRGTSWAGTESAIVWQFLQFGPILVGLGLLVAINPRWVKPDGASKLFFVGVASFLFVAILSAITSVSRVETVSQWAISVLMFLFMGWNAVSRWPRDRSSIRGDLVILASFFTGVQVAGLLVLVVSPFHAIGEYGRFVGLYSNASYTGIISALTITLLLYLMTTSRSRRAVVTMSSACLPLVLALVLSGSRASWIAVSLSVGLLLAIRARGWFLRSSIAAVACALCVFVLVVPISELRSPAMTLPLPAPVTSSGTQQSATPSPIAPKPAKADDAAPQDAFGELDEKSSGRLGLYLQAMDAWLDSPALGNGYRTAPLVVGGFQTHNLILQVLVETGVLGLAALGACVVAFALKLKSRRAEILFVAPLLCIFITELSSSSLFGWGGTTALYSWTAIAAFFYIGSNPAQKLVKKSVDSKLSP